MEARSIAAGRAEPRTFAAPRATAAFCRAADLLIAGLLVALLAPVMLIVAFCVRLDSPGPALFRQPRVGRGGRTFTLLKFRTMVVGADSAPHRDYIRSLINGGATAEDPVGNALFKLTGDARLTRLGGALRRWSLDELPQLLNVVAGHMSLVGPRPGLDYEVAMYPDWYLERLAVRPGITGLWQVNGRNERTFEEMVRLDIEYVRRMSVRLYASIVLKTPRAVLGRRGVV
jgi:lipopolysaccharide/colanic/teichoic acid biosynthesis glycosyltransferase